LISDHVWVGWPQPCQSENDKEALTQADSTLTVFLTEEAMDKFYLGFCKDDLALFHYFSSYTVYEQNTGPSIARKSNFCDTIVESVNQVILFDHDYHLMLVPRMLLGFAWHPDRLSPYSIPVL
jgi:trehalose 6-phosphate synthase/phosphatase